MELTSIVRKLTLVVVLPPLVLVVVEVVEGLSLQVWVAVVAVVVVVVAVCLVASPLHGGDRVADKEQAASLLEGWAPVAVAAGGCLAVVVWCCGKLGAQGRCAGAKSTLPEKISSMDHVVTSG